MGTQTADRAHDILRRPPPRLDSIFAPKTVAIIGASEEPGSVGQILLQNLLAGSLRGAIYPVNPKHSHILGVKAFPNIKEAPHPIDLAVIQYITHWKLKDALIKSRLMKAQAVLRDF